MGTPHPFSSRVPVPLPRSLAPYAASACSGCFMETGPCIFGSLPVSPPRGSGDQILVPSHGWVVPCHAAEAWRAAILQLVAIRIVWLDSAAPDASQPVSGHRFGLCGYSPRRGQRG